MKNLLICSDSFLPRWDGIARFLRDVIPPLSYEYNIKVVAPKFPGEPPTFARVKLVRVPLTSIRAADYAFSRFPRATVRELVEWANIVWTHTIGPIGGAGILEGKRSGKPVVSYIHSLEWELFSKSISRQALKGLVYKSAKGLAKHLYSKSSLLLVPNLEVGDILQSNGIFTPSKPLFLGVDTNHFKPPEQKGLAKHAIGIKEELKLIGYCGRIGREKDLFTLYRAYLRVRKKLSGTRLIIVGGGVHDLDRHFSSKEDILVFGSQNNILPFLQALDVFVLPSLTETTSLATLEAMACGVPPVATRVGQVKEYVSDGWNGLFFPQKDPFLLSVKLLELLKDDRKRSEMGMNARRTVVEMYDLEKTIGDIRHVLEVF
jgi:glycosyltransferase involved in cell wall biosynthesis